MKTMLTLLLAACASLGMSGTYAQDMKKDEMKRETMPKADMGKEGMKPPASRDMMMKDGISRDEMMKGDMKSPGPDAAVGRRRDACRCRSGSRHSSASAVSSVPSPIRPKRFSWVRSMLREMPSSRAVRTWFSWQYSNAVVNSRRSICS